MKQHFKERRSLLTIHYSKEQPRSVSESFQEHQPEPPWVNAGTVPQSQQRYAAFARGGSGPWIVFTEEEPRNCESYQNLPVSNNWNGISFLVSVLIARAEQNS